MGVFIDVLIAPMRTVPRLQDLTPPEVASLFTSVQTVGRVVERVYGADGLTIACQVRYLLSEPSRIYSAVQYELCVLLIPRQYELQSDTA